MNNEVNEHDWAARTAMRLRIVQGTMVESEEEDRGVQVWEFIAQALDEIAAVDPVFHQRCLQALDEEFPFFEARAPLPYGSENENPTAPFAAAAEPATTSATELARQLAAQAGSMSGEEKSHCMKLLAEAGLVPAPAGGADGRSMPAVLTLPVYEEEIVRLKRTVERILQRLVPESATTVADPSLNLIRGMQMLGLMCEQFLLLHPQVWSLWDRLGGTQHHTTSFQRPPLEATQALADFLRGSSATRRSDVGDMVAKSFYLVTALVQAVSEAGRDFAIWYLQRFGPENIQSVMGFETGTSQAGPAEFWKRYVELTQLHNEEDLKMQFQSLLGKAVLRQLQKRPGSTAAR